MKRRFTAFSLKEAMQLVPADRFTPWNLSASPRPPSEFLKENMRRLRSFDLTGSEAAKILLIDTLLAEIIPDYENLRVWKGALLESDTLTGYADYLIAPDCAYITTPLLCVAEAKRDDFEQGRVQCLIEMIACLQQNRQAGHEIDLLGIVSNGQVWQFYKLTPANCLFETGYYTTEFLPELLGVLAHICDLCSAAVPQSAP